MSSLDELIEAMALHVPADAAAPTSPPLPVTLSPQIDALPAKPTKEQMHEIFQTAKSINVPQRTVKAAIAAKKRGETSSYFNLMKVICKTELQSGREETVEGGGDEEMATATEGSSRGEGI